MEDQTAEVRLRIIKDYDQGWTAVNILTAALASIYTGVSSMLTKLSSSFKAVKVYINSSTVNTGIISCSVTAV